MADENTPEQPPPGETPEPKAESTPPAKPEAVPPTDEKAKPAEAAAAEKAPDAPLPGLEEDPAPATKTVAGRRRSKSGKVVPVGIVFIKATFNNTIVSITDVKGNVVAWSSAGRGGFKGSRKSTAFAATVVSQEAARQAVAMGMNEVEVRVQGPGAGRESAIRALQSAGLSVSAIKDVTPVPHNGCRPRKRRRV
jgi:small subunit ribosomal protein S11